MSIEVRNEEDIVQMGLDYAFRILEIQKQIAEAKADIKAIKTDAKLDGIPVALVDKAISKIKADMKKTEAQKFEEQAWVDALTDNQDIENKIAEINNV